MIEDANFSDSDNRPNKTDHTSDDEWIPESRIETRVVDQLRTVLDPCSCFTDEPVNIVDLGLIEDVSVVDHTAKIELLLTSPGCTYLPYIERDVEEQIRSLPMIHTVEVEQPTNRVWTRDRKPDDIRKS